MREVKLRRTKAQLKFQEEFNLRRCSECGEMKDVTEFSLTGNNRLRGHCKDCRKIIERNRRAEKKAKALLVTAEEKPKSLLSKVKDWLLDGRK